METATKGKINDEKYDSLYLKILQIGRERVCTGISYNELMKRLADEGYDTNNNCVIRAVKHWFIDSFWHAELHDRKEVVGLTDIDAHATCNFIMNGETCLLLLQHEENTRGLEIAKDGVKIARNGVTMAKYAILVAIVGILLTVFVTMYAAKKDNKPITDINMTTPAPQLEIRQPLK